MDLQKLKAMGLTTSNPLVKRDIPITYHPLKPAKDWADPAEPEREDTPVTDSISVYLRKYTAADVIALNVCRDDQERCYTALQRAVFTEDGAKLFPSMDEAYGVNLVVFAPLLTAISELNGGVAKKSLRKMSSGASSRSPSARRSKSSATASAKTKPTSGSSTEPSSAP